MSEIRRIFARKAWVHGDHLDKDVLVICEDGIVQDLIPMAGGAKSDSAEELCVDLLLPGFVNAHCHLEYSNLRGILPPAPEHFGEWLQAIVKQKSATTAGNKSEAMTFAVRELAAGGCTTVVDSTTDGASAQILQQAGLRYFLFHEVLGLTGQQNDALANFNARRVQSDTLCIGHGINPHAPYSVGQDLRASVLQLLVDDPSLVCAWHLAESSDELELFAHASGPIRTFLESLGLPLPFPEEDAGVVFDHPSTFLLHSGLHSHCHIAFHANFPHEIDLRQFIAPNAIVHCPAAHQWFNRPPFPLMDLLDAGVNVCLGTDSFAGSTSLSMLEAVRLAAGCWPQLNDQQLIGLASRNASRSRLLSGIGDLTGIIAPGAAADLVGFSVPDHHQFVSVREALCDRGSEVQVTMVTGHIVHMKPYIS